MQGYLKIDGELFDIPGLSYGAMMLYAFIKLRMGIANQDSNGVRFINYRNGNDPHEALHASRKQILKWTKELCDNDLVYTDGHGIGFKVYLKTDFISLNNDSEEDKYKYPKGNLNEEDDKIQVPKRELFKYPKGDLSSTQKGTCPLISYKETLTNTNKVYINTDSKSPNLIPTLEEVEEEAKERGYSCNCSDFYDYNRMRGWKNVSDWRAALSLYNRNFKNKTTFRRSNSVTGAEAGIETDNIIDNIIDTSLNIQDQDHISEADLDNLIDIFEAQ